MTIRAKRLEWANSRTTYEFSVGAALALAVAAVLILSAGFSNAVRANPGGLVISIGKSHVKTCNPEQEWPDFPAYDPQTKEVYVPNYASHTITVISGKCTVVGEITPSSADAGPTGAAYDPANGYVYVTDYYTSVVYEISGTTIVATITNSAFQEPWGIAYDPDDQSMVVANSDNYYVSVFNEQTSFFKDVPVGAGPRGVAFDAEFGNLVVTNFASGNVTILNATHLTHVADLETGTDPLSVAFDATDDEDYVANYGSNTVSVIEDETVETQITGFDEPSGITYSSGNGELYVGNYGSNSVSAVSGASIVKTYTGTTGAYGAVYDPHDHYVYVGNRETYGLYLIKV